MNRSVLVLAVLALFSVVEAGGQPLNASAFVLLPVKNDPTISFRIWFKAGSQNDPAGKEGLAYITGQMLADASTRTHTYAQIIDKLYPLAAGYNASVSAEMTVISGRVHKDNLEAFYPLFRDAILLPAFTQGIWTESRARPSTIWRTLCATPVMRSSGRRFCTTKCSRVRGMATSLRGRWPD